MELYKGKYFDVVYTDWNQDFLGTCIISGKKESLSEMLPEEWLELGELEKELERVTKKLFDSTMYNFCCLMNNAYRDNEKPHVHFWFFPRYKNEVNIFGKKYVDKHFGYNFWKWNRSRLKSQKDIFTKEEREKIFYLMKEEWSLNGKQKRGKKSK